MRKQTVRFSVVCPDRGKEHLAEFAIAYIVKPLRNNVKIYLRSRCHNAGWPASSTGVEQVRQYLTVRDGHSTISAPYVRLTSDSARKFIDVLASGAIPRIRIG